MYDFIVIGRHMASVPAFELNTDSALPSIMSVEKANQGPLLHLLVILYGSRKHEEVSVNRFKGYDQRRVEIDMRLRLPRKGMGPAEIAQFGQYFMGTNYQSFKHSQKWGCEFCGALVANLRCAITLIEAEQTNLRVCLKAR